MKLFTIGFTRTSAEHFFGRLSAARVRRLIDVRLKNVSQLAGFAKRDDLAYFARTICGIPYEHRPELAPTHEMLADYQQKRVPWPGYAERFGALMRARHIEDLVTREALDGACLLCSEAEPHRCHRRLVAEHLAERWGDVEIVHL